MKNKIIPLLLIVALIILFLPKTVLATTKEFNLFSVDIPDTYEEIFKNVSDTAENLTYKRIIILWVYGWSMSANILYFHLEEKQWKSS